MAKIFSNSLNKRITFYFIIIAIIVIAAFIYTSVSTTTNSLKEEVQKRVDVGLETFSLVIQDTIDKLFFDSESLVQDGDILDNVIALQDVNYEDLSGQADYTILKDKLKNELVSKGLSILTIVDTKGRVIVSANSDQTGQKLSLRGFIEDILKEQMSVSSNEIITAEELLTEGESISELAKIKRIPSLYQKDGWREQEVEDDALMMTAVSMIKKNGIAIGALVGGVILNNDNTIPDRIVESGGGIASINLYDARIATTQILGNTVRGIGTLTSEDVVNTVYVAQHNYSGRAYEMDDWYFVAYEPLRNYDNEVVGSIARGIKESEAVAGVESLQLKFIIIGVLALAFIYIATQLITRTITGPLKKLASNSYKISRGNLEIDIEAPDREDEIGDLTHSFIIMKDKLREYYTKLEDLVAKRTQELRHKVKDLETARHSIEDEKNKSESILKNVGDGVLALNHEKKFIACNDAASELLEYSTDEIIGQDLSKIIKLKNTKLTSSNKDFNPVTESIKSKTVIMTGTGEFSIITKKKKEIPVTITATPLKDNSGEVHGGVLVMKDVTKEQEIDKMKSEFVSVASHQLRTPLSASKWFLEMLINKEAGAINKEQAEYLDHIFKSNERMIALVNDLLNVSRIESGTIAIEPLPTNIDGLVRSVIFELTPQVKKKNIKTVFQSVKGGLPNINIDPKLIRQVFQNLLSNAVKYTSEKGSVGVRVKTDKNYATFEIFDTGVGIPKKQQPKVFKKFFRADNVITMQTEGTGLGLYVAKSIVDASGGKIWFESVEGKGTSFFFTLPLTGSKRRAGEKTLI
ncbi:cache domain-containing protein [Patescibacteria group bacterium]|nr:cache domain-containing protein [Patescibacteria group bacterium]MBU1890641.1 cache domain-containing protein [Patescibacteria group bacterium]